MTKCLSTLFTGASLMYGPAAHAAHFSVLYAMQDGIDGTQPGNMLFKNGVLYVSVSDQGVYNSGNLIKIDPETGARTILHGFTGAGDGEIPGLLVAPGDTIYGTTFEGGSAYSINGGGSLFAYNTATETLEAITTFAGSAGTNPVSLVSAPGVLYGATLFGGSVSGTVFKFDLATHQQSVLADFAGGAGGYRPSGLIRSGTSLYGLAEGGAAGYGLVFRIDLATQQETIVYSFTGGSDQGYPTSLVDSGQGVLYGTTGGAASGQYGTVFALDLASSNLTNVYTLSAGEGWPHNLVYADGLLYGVTSSDGVETIPGSVFEVDPATGQETVLHSFTGGNDGEHPTFLTFARGALYGSTIYGGATQSGVVFKIEP